MVNQLICALIALGFSGEVAFAQESKGGCRHTDTPGLCVDTVGTLHTTASARAACENSQQNFVAHGCPSAGLIGSCVAGKEATRVVYRYYREFSAGKDGAKKECAALRGQWKDK